MEVNIEKHVKVGGEGGGGEGRGGVKDLYFFTRFWLLLIA